MLAQKSNDKTQDTVLCNNKIELIQIANNLKRTCGFDSLLFLYDKNLDSVKLFQSDQNALIQQGAYAFMQVLQKPAEMLDISNFSHQM